MQTSGNNMSEAAHPLEATSLTPIEPKAPHSPISELPSEHSKSSLAPSMAKQQSSRSFDRQMLGHRLSRNCRRRSMLLTPQSSIISRGPTSSSSVTEDAMSSSTKTDGVKLPPRPSLVEPDDVPDSLPTDLQFSWWDIVITVCSIISFTADIGTDIAVAVVHFKNQAFVYFGLTTAFVILPTIITTCISLRWYHLDSREAESPRVSKLAWAARILFHLFQFGPIVRYVQSLRYGLRYRRDRNEKYLRYMVFEDTDATMLRLFECFMEAAPQLLLQLYILSNQPIHDDPWSLTFQVGSCLTSLVALAWSLVSYQRTLRMSLPHKSNMDWKGFTSQLSWRLSMIASRMLALALFASIFSWWVAVVAAVHWLLMLGWIIRMKTSFCDNRLEELAYDAILAIMFIYCYFNPVDSPTRYRYAKYYSFNFVENSLLLAAWFTYSNPSLWYRLPALYTHYALFALGILLMLIYYLFFHPTQAIRCCLGVDDNEKDRRDWVADGGYKRQASSGGLWSTFGKVLHPRPAEPTSRRSLKRPVETTVELNASNLVGNATDV